MTSVPVLLQLTSTMGQALFKIQNAERVLKLALQWVGADPNVTLAGLEALEASLQRVRRLAPHCACSKCTSRLRMTSRRACVNFWPIGLCSYTTFLAYPASQ
jgi:hypothetical protein